MQAFVGTRVASRISAIPAGHARAAGSLAVYVVAVVAVVVSVVCLASCSREPVGARHVIFISLDTARADHFGFMGNDWVRTPELDALAAESIVFSDYMAVIPSTLPSHVSLMTGKYPHHHGTPRNGFMVNGENTMLAEILREEGFRTVGFAASFSLSGRFGFAQGFNHYDEEFGVHIALGVADQEQRLAEDVTDAVIAHLDEQGVAERLFLFVHYFDPHLAYTAPAPFDTMYDPRGREDLPAVRYVKQSEYEDPELREEHARRHTLQYASEISYMDHHVGRLLDDLRRRGILDDAIVVVTSDHGESLWEHDEHFHHGFTVYQSTMHSVCTIRLPGGTNGGARSTDLVASIDVLPTVLDFLEIGAPDAVDGEAIPLAVVENGAGFRERFGEAAKPWQDVETDPLWTNIRKSRCVRSGSHKFIWTPYTADRELYDVADDPAEITDLMVGRTRPTDELARELMRKLEAWTDSAAPLPSRFEPTETDETVSKLRSLGYLQ